MADVSTFAANGVTYNIKDATARDGVAALQITSGQNYIKLPDGTMIAWVWQSYSNTAFDSTWGSLYYSSELTLPNWPVSFYGTPYAVASAQGGNDVFLGTITNTSNTSAGKCYAYKPVTGNVTVSIAAIGIGRWKA